MSINTGLNLKTSFFDREKGLYNKSEISSILMQCSLKCSIAFFFTNDIFQGTFVSLRFMKFTNVFDERIGTYLAPCP